MTLTVLGIDISKRDFHVSLLKESHATKQKRFTNNIQEFESLHRACGISAERLHGLVMRSCDREKCAR
jgi:transposase